jgi:hypothetical protein
LQQCKYYLTDICGICKLKIPQIDEFAITVFWDVTPRRDLPSPCSEFGDSMSCRKSYINQNTRVSRPSIPSSIYSYEILCRIHFGHYWILQQCFSRFKSSRTLRRVDWHLPSSPKYRRASMFTVKHH